MENDMTSCGGFRWYGSGKEFSHFRLCCRYIAFLCIVFIFNEKTLLKSYGKTAECARNIPRV